MPELARCEYILRREKPMAYRLILPSLQVLLSKAWDEAAEKGRWASEVRPFTSNRRHILRKVI